MKQPLSNIGLRLNMLAGNVLYPTRHEPKPAVRLADLSTASRLVMFMLVVMIVLVYTPDLVQAEVGKMGPGTVADDFLKGTKAWWTFFAQIAVIGGLVGAVFMFFVDKRWVMVPLGVAGIGAFGEDIARWFLEQGSHQGLVIGSGKK